MAEQTASEKREQGRKDDLLATAKKRFLIAQEAEAEQRTLALEDIRFADGDQWPEEIKEVRRRENRPCLTINRMPQFVQHITNEQRQNPISIKVNPVGDADKDTADVYEGLIRHIENQSNADEAYSNGFDYAVKGGWGFWRVITDYADEFSFDQEIYIKKVENPFSVYLDPGGSESDASDAEYGFVVTDYTKEQYEDMYPSSKWSQAGVDWTGTGNSWMGKDTIRVAEYFYRENREIEIVQTSDGQVYQASALDKGPDGQLKLRDSIYVKQRRKTSVPFVRWALINGDEVLDEQMWAGKYIPIVRDVGQVTNIDGKRLYKGIVRDARDPQLQFNLMRSAETEAIALSPKAPYMGTNKQFAGYEAEWKTMNTRNRPYLRYNVDPDAPGPPIRNEYNAPIQAITLAGNQAADDLKATAGIYDAALGAGANDVSGRAINARQQQTYTSLFHFADNHSRSIRHTGKILIDLIPYIYNTDRVVRIIKEDGTQENLRVNVQPDAQGQLPNGVQQIYDLTTGKYDVTISTGPSYQTKRQEAVDTQMQLIKTDPQLLGIIGDIIVANMDIPGAQEIAERLKTTLPPAIAALDQKNVNLPPEMQAIVAQQQAQVQQLQQALQQAQDDAKHGISKAQMETASRERIEAAKIEASIVIAELTAKAQMAQSDAKNELDFLRQQIGQAHEAGMSQMGAQQQQDMQKQAQQQQGAQEPVQ